MKTSHPWFGLGVRAVKSKFSSVGLPEGYVCPLCVIVKDGRLGAKVFHDLKGLTREHVPPKNSGGKRMVLTCRDCNSSAGHAVDVHLGNLHQRLAPPPNVGGKATVAGQTVNVGIDWTNRSFTVSGAHNHPERVRQFIGGLQKGEPVKVQSDQPSYDLHRAKVSLVRAAYLAAFAALGYSYIFADSLEVVREQIRSPDSDFRVFGSQIKGAAASARMIGIVAKPQEFYKAVVVQIGPFITLLPPPSKETGFYEQFHEGMFANFELRQPPWPKKPEFFYDFSP